MKGLFVKVLLALLLGSIGSAQMSPMASDTANWDAWLVNAEAIAAEVEAPSQAVREVEVQELISLAETRDEAGLEQISYWNAAAPSYRWTQVLADAYRSGPRNPAVFRTFALLNVGIYYATVATWKAKYAGEASTMDAGTPAAFSEDLEVLVPSGQHPSFPSEHAAVAVVASEILAYLQPDNADSFRAMADEAMESRLLAGANFRSDIEAGKVIGRAVAEEIIAWAKADGSDTAWDYTAPEGTLFTVESPVFPMTGTWKTLAIENGQQFRAPEPPAYDSERIQADLEEIKAVERTLGNMHQASYWAIFYTGYEVWYDLASKLLFEKRMADNAPHMAKIYAALGVAAYDSIVGCFDSKYEYVYARPSQIDASVEPLIPVPPHPSYPSAHSCGSGAMAHVITHFFPHAKDDVHTLAQEAGQSRILAGIHYQIDNEAGLELGEKVGEVVIAKLEAMTQ